MERERAKRILLIASRAALAGAIILRLVENGAQRVEARLEPRKCTPFTPLRDCEDPDCQWHYRDKMRLDISTNDLIRMKKEGREFPF